MALSCHNGHVRAIGSSRAKNYYVTYATQAG